MDSFLRLDPTISSLSATSSLYPTPMSAPATSTPPPRNYRILIFSWNTESISLCETMSDTQAAINRSGFNMLGTTLTTWRYPTEIPDFLPQLLKLIADQNPDIIVIGFQEDRHPGSYFHSHLLPEEMPKIGYGLVKRTKLMGVGVTTYKGLVTNGDLFRRGVRVSIYARTHLVPMIEQEEISLRETVTNDGQEEHVCTSFLTRGKGATVSYLMLPGFGPLAFICCHLPFDAKSLITERAHQNRLLRQNQIMHSNACFNDIINKFVMLRQTKPAHVWFFGDFNYRISIIDRPATVIAEAFLNPLADADFIRRIYDQYDELKNQMRKGDIYNFEEGIDDAGPIFLPTCKMNKHRHRLLSSILPRSEMEENGSELALDERLIRSSAPSPHTLWKMGKHDQRVPSWCDRILYQRFDMDGHRSTCRYYNRFDWGATMSKSDHAAVVAVFDLI